VGVVDEVINQIKPQPLAFEFGNYPWLTWGFNLSDALFLSRLTQHV
jgi:hypothetical protein